MRSPSHLLFRVATLTVLLVAIFGLLSGLVANAQEPANSAETNFLPPVGTLFTYQGLLEDNGTPANGTHDFEFKLYDLPSGGIQIGSTLTLDNINVSAGRFAVELDFGSTAFTGDARYLSVGVRPGTSTGTYTTLNPRQPLTSSPYSLHSSSTRGLFVSSANDVGINTTDTSLARLTVQGSPNTHDDPIGVLSFPVRTATGGQLDYRFQVQGHTTSNFSNLSLRLPSSGANHRFGIINSSGNYTLWARADGNVAINTNADSDLVDRARLVVQGSPNTHDDPIGVLSFPVRTATGGQLDYRFQVQGHTTSNFSNLSLRLPSSGANHRFGITNNSGDTIFWARGDGNIGMGTNNPQARLDVAGTARADVVQIDGGSDLAEPFDIADADKLEPGMVVAIDPENAGQLRVATTAYDRMVAGVISGAGGVNPGLIMHQEGMVSDEALPVALTGRVYVWVDASYGAVQVGDMLTTSNTPGYAMRVSDYTHAQGAILGKAMTSLEDGQGLVLVLVTLQ